MNADDGALFSLEPDDDLDSAQEPRVDVLVLTALKDELDALLVLGQSWTRARDERGFPYHRCMLSSGLRIAAAWIGEMGQTSAKSRGKVLIRELAPECLAMCGNCVGDPDQVSLGDLIVVDRLWAYDEGKQVENKFYHSMNLFPIERTWGMNAAFARDWLDIKKLAAERPPSKEMQTRWLLHALYAYQFDHGPAPTDHAERKTFCPAFADIVKTALAEQFIVREGRALRLTEVGKDRVDEDVLLYPDGMPSEKPHAIHIGAMAMGSALVKDEGIFPRLRAVVRETMALDMEGAAIAQLADDEQKMFLVVKAVQNYPHNLKDDTYRTFGCRASAKFLLAFLEKKLEPRREIEEVPRRTRFDWHEREWNRERERENAFLRRVEQAAALRHPNAKITRRHVKPPFAGALELCIHEDFLDTSLVVALDEQLTYDTWRRFCSDIHEPARRRDAAVRVTLVHRGETNPLEMVEDAAVRRIALRTFREYQGLFDLKPFLEWQTERLLHNPIYPPELYIDAPAQWQVSGSREWTAIENALEYLWKLLATRDERRFALVLGDFGAGKTFLLRELARRMYTQNHGVWPVLLEMHLLEKQHSLSELIGAQFSKAEVYGYNYRAFQCMLNEGRIALLFDGFDELAERVTYDTVTDHFNTVLAATQGELAKVVLSSRRQHFLSETQVKLALTERAEKVSGFRLVTLSPFGDAQIHQYLQNHLGDGPAADERYALIDEIKDLLGLSHNPRMLGFIMKIPEAELRQAKAHKEDEITSADLYDLLVKQWLKNEHERLKRISTQKCLSLAALEKGVTALALSMWHARAKDVPVEHIRNVIAQALRGLSEPELPPKVLEQMFASGSLLVRDADARFSFVHRSVLEWLVARESVAALLKREPSTMLEADEMSVLMADFVIDMAGRDIARSWAQEALERNAESWVKNNAATVLVRIDKRWRPAAKVRQAPSVLRFAGTDLRGKDLSGVDWRQADLRGANLERATLIGADLSGANLEDARLYRANLTNAKLAGAKLAKADLRITRLLKADLTGAQGLESAALFRTNLAGAKLPEVFDPAKVDPYGVGVVPRRPEPVWAGTAMTCHCVAWNDTGELLAAGFGDGTVRLFDTGSGELLRVFVGHSSAVRGLTFSPDGQTIASASDDTTVRLWDATFGHSIRTFEGHTNAVNFVAFSPRGDTIASASADNTVRLWDVSNEPGRCIHVLDGHTHGVWSVAFSPDAGLVASASDDKTLRLWDAFSGRFLRVLRGHRASVLSVAFSPDGATIVSGSGDNSLRLWDALSAERSRHVLEGHTNGVLSVVFSPDGQRIASGSSDKTLRLWDASSGRCLRTLEGHQNRVRGVAFSPDGKTVATGSYDNSVRLWDASSGRCLRALEGRQNRVRSLAFSPDGKTVASGPHNKTLRLWDVSSGRCLRELEGHPNWVMNAAFSSDGKVVATGASDGVTRLWDASSGRFLRAFEGHRGGVYSVAFSVDRQTIATGSHDKTLRLWDISSGRCLHILEGHQDWVMSVAFGPDGKTLASGSSDRTLRLWDVSSGGSLHVLEGHQNWVKSVAFGSDGKTLASGSYDMTLRLWDASSGRFLRVLEGHRGWVNSVAFSPEGKILASGSEDNSLRLWDAGFGKCLRVLEGHSAAVTSVAFSPRGKTIASGSQDGTIRLWDIASGKCYAILFAGEDGWVAFSPDGRYKYGGDIRGSFWHIVGLCRFELSEVAELQLPDDADFRTLAPMAAGALPAR